MFSEMNSTVANQSRWLIAVRGIVAIIFGIIAIVWPGISLIAIVYLFGAFALITGILALIASFQVRRFFSSWWAVLIEGLVGIAIGLLTFFWPGITTLVLYVLIAVWAIIMGIFEIAAAFSQDASAGERWMMGVAGLLSIIFGILLFMRPGAGLLVVVWLIGFYALIWGILLIAHSMQRSGRTSQPPTPSYSS